MVISFGQWRKLDCNHYFLGATTVRQMTLKGYGYTYYELDTQNSTLAGTKMACPPGKKQNKFVKYANTLTLPYNHRLPLVFYAPKNVKVQYQIYKRTQSGFGYFE